MPNENQKDRFEKALSNAGETQTTLLKKILLELNPNKGYDEIIELANKERSNFSNSISGNRGFSSKYFIYMEKYLKTSMYYLLYGEDEKNPGFINKGIRYTASLDNYQAYVDLSKETDDDGYSIMENMDEYECYLLDYIFQFRSLQGLIFLAKEYGCKVDQENISIYGHNIRLYSKATEGSTAYRALELICSKDSAEVYKLYFNPFFIWNVSDNRWKGCLVYSNSLKAILGTKNVFKEFLTSKIVDTKENFTSMMPQFYGITAEKVMLCNPILFDLLSYALENPSGYKEKIISILEFGIQYNQKSLEYLNKYYGNQDYQLEEDGRITAKGHNVLLGNLLTYKHPSNIEPLDEDIQILLSKLDDQIIKFHGNENKITFDLYQTVRYSNGKAYKKPTGNKDEYDFLKLMNAKKFPYIPTYAYDENQQLDTFTWWNGKIKVSSRSITLDIVLFFIKQLKEMNTISMNYLGNGKTYVHGDLSPQNVIFKGDEIQGIIDFDTVSIGEEWKDFIYVAWKWLDISNYARDNKVIFESLLKMIETYDPSPDFKKNFADKMIQVIDEHIALLEPEYRDYETLYQSYTFAKSWVELYRERITKEIG